MDITKTKTEEGLELGLSGRLDAHRASHLEAELEEAVRAGEHRIALGMKDVSFISSAGLRVLITYSQKLRQLDGQLSVKEPSEACLLVLRLTGMSDLLLHPAAAPVAAPAETGVPRADERRQEGLECSIYTLGANARLNCTFAGDPQRLQSFEFEEAGVRTASFPIDTLAVGLGALGPDVAECRTRMGEFLVAGGAAVCLPSDTGVPDYLVTTGDLIPQVQALYAISAQGPMSHCIRFSCSNGPAAMTRVVEMSLDAIPADTIGLVMIAETAGLIGASLRRSPMEGDRSERMFDHPAIRRWLSFTPERVFDRSVALVVGIASRVESGALGAYLRPLSAGGNLRGHFHAAVFSFKAMRKGLIQLDQEVNALFQEKSLQAVMHLINDDREIVGAGESLFIQGAVWCAPLGSISREGL